MYGERFTPLMPCVLHVFSKRMPSMSTTSTSSRSKVAGCPTCSISARRLNRCEHRSSPDKQIRVAFFSQIRLIFNVIASRQIRWCMTQGEDNSSRALNHLAERGILHRHGRLHEFLHSELVQKRACGNPYSGQRAIA